MVNLWFQDGAGGVPQGFQVPPLVYGNFQCERQWKMVFEFPKLVKLANFRLVMKRKQTQMDH